MLARVRLPSGMTVVSQPWRTGELVVEVKVARWRLALMMLGLCKTNGVPLTYWPAVLWAIVRFLAGRQ
jgi:hypothetical protein